MEDKYRYEYSPEEKEIIRAELVDMNNRVAELWKDQGPHPRVKELRDNLKNNP